MKNLLTLIASLLLLTGSLNATHIAGGDLTCTNIGGSDYLVTLTFYRDCSGINELSGQVIKFSSSCTGTFNLTINKISPINGIEVTYPCPSMVSACVGGALFGMEKFVYQGQVTLNPCSDWVISYVEGNRNPSNTIQSPEYAYMYLQATLNNLDAPSNSLPSFLNPPLGIISNGQTLCYSGAVIEPDGDSLSYQLITPFDQGPGSGSVYVTYLPGFSFGQPLYSTPPVSMDAHTGDLCMTPTTNLTTVVAILVEERRVIGGVPTIIGSVIRDMQLTVITSNNAIPNLAGLNDLATQYDENDSIYSITACSGNPLSLHFFSDDANIPQDSLIMIYDQSIPFATWSVVGDGGQNPIGTLDWTPVYSDTSDNTHCFTVKIIDDNCPYLGFRTLTYCIEVLTAASIQIAIDTICNDAAAIVLTGGLPAGGTYFGDAVTAGSFDPAAAVLGSNTVYYFYSGLNPLCPDTVADSIWVQNCAGINQIANNSRFVISPNPFQQQLLISGRELNGSQRIYITDLAGRTLYTITKVMTGTTNFSIDLSFLKQGLYLLNIDGEEGRFITRILKE